MTERHGFELFQHRIEEITRALGGSAEARALVAGDFSKRLDHVLAELRGVNLWGLPAEAWTTATPAEYEAAAAHCVGLFTAREPLAPVEAEAPWKGATLRRRGSGVWIEGGHFAAIVANSYQDDKRDRRGATSPSWHVYIPDDVARAVNRSAHGPKATNVKSEESVRSSLDRLVSTFFRVELRPVQ